MATPTGQDNSKLDTKKNILKRLIQVTMSVILIAILLLVSAGKIDWIYAWVYIASSVLVIIINACIFPRELISERGRKKDNVEKKITQGTVLCLIIYPDTPSDQRINHYYQNSKKKQS